MHKNTEDCNCKALDSLLKKLIHCYLSWDPVHLLLITDCGFNSVLYFLLFQYAHVHSCDDWPGHFKCIERVGVGLDSQSPVVRTKCWQLTFLQTTYMFKFVGVVQYVPYGHIFDKGLHCIFTRTTAFLHL